MIYFPFLWGGGGWEGGLNGCPLEGAVEKPHPLKLLPDIN